MRADFELSSPSKINLFLDVLKKRDDGYHDILTVFEKIDLCDKISFSAAESKSGASGGGIDVSSSAQSLPSGENNLAYRACSLLKKRCGISKGVKIHIEKRIPVAAGLGGGSSNAATVLKGLNRLWDLRLTEKELSDLGKEIGADVPFFIFNNTFAVGSGRGDEIDPIDTSLDMWHVLISPPYRVFTKEVYEEVNLGLTGAGPDVRILVRAVEEKNVGEVGKRIYNALGPVVAGKIADISSAMDVIKGWGFNAAGITGSGPTIFVLAFSRKEALELERRLADSFASDGSRRGWRIFVAKTATTERKE